MPVSTITSKGQTTVPRAIREALNVGPGDKLLWEIRGGAVAISTERPSLYALEGFLKQGPDALTAIARARDTRGRIV